MGYCNNVNKLNIQTNSLVKNVNKLNIQTNSPVKNFFKKHGGMILGALTRLVLIGLIGLLAWIVYSLGTFDENNSEDERCKNAPRENDCACAQDADCQSGYCARYEESTSNQKFCQPKP